MIKMNLSIGLMFLVLHASAVPASCEEVREIPEDLIPSSRKEVTEILNIASRSKFENAGWLLPTDDITKFELGTPYPQYDMDIEKLLGIDEQSDFYEALKFSSWKIPILFNGEPRSAITMIMEDGKWKLLHYCGDPMPITYARSKWPANDGYYHSYVSSTCGPDFIMIEKGGEILCYPFSPRNESILGIQKNSEGRYPVMTLKSMLEHYRSIKSGHYIKN